MPTGRSALWSQLGLALETTVGTRATPTRFLEYLQESLALSIDRMESAGLRSTNRFLRTDRWLAGKKSVAGDLDFEVQTKGFGMIFELMFGAAPTIITAPGGTTSKKQTFVPGDPFGIAATIQVGRPDVGSTVDPFDYTGCKVSSWSLSNAVDGFLMLKTTIDGWTEDTSQSLASASYPTSTEILAWIGGTLNIGGSPVSIRDITINGAVGLKTDRFLIRSSTTKKEPLAASFYVVSGDITAEFESISQYARFVNGTMAQIDVTWTGLTALEGAIFPSVKVTMPNCRFDGTTPNVPGPGDVLVQKLPFKALYDGTNQPITLDYITLDTTV